MEKEKLSYLSLDPHFKNLRVCGIYPLSKDATKMRKIIHAIYMRLSILFVLTYVAQEIIKIYQVKEDIIKVMDTVLLLLTNSDYLFKQIVIWNKSDKIEELVSIMKGPIFNQDVKEHKKLLTITIRQAKILLRSFNGIAVFTCMLWVLCPLILHLQGKHVEFSVWIPFDVNTVPNFYIAIVYIWIQTSYVAYNNTTIDAFITFFLAQSTTQLSILRLDLEKMVYQSKEEAKKYTLPYSLVVKQNFKKIILHNSEIMKFTRLIQDIFGGATFYQFLVGGWILCTTAYRTVTINPASVEFMSMILYLSCIIAEIYLYCYFGHGVHSESELVLNSAYNMNWLELPMSVRKDLIIYMERIKRPIVPLAGSLIPLSKSTFVSIMRSSYSFYMFLRSTDY